MSFLRWLFPYRGGGGREQARRSTIPHVQGEAPSGGFQRRRRLKSRGPSPALSAKYDPIKLATMGLPSLQTRRDLADALGVSEAVLGWLAMHGKGHLAHYREHIIPKRTSGRRKLLAPKKHLKTAQRWVLDNILAKVPAGDCVHGFTKRRSIVTNAQGHTGCGMVVSTDLVNFFPSIGRASVKGLFVWMGYGAEVAETLSLLCTASADGGRRRALPQGAPTSPAISNLVCWRLDRRLCGLAAKFEATYTRYADDITFSGNKELKNGMKRFLPMLTFIIGQEGFAINKQKRRFMRKGSRQEVTGLVVNDKPGRPREELRQLRAILHNCRVQGPATQNRNNDPAFLERLAGRIGVVKMASPMQGDKLLAELKAVREAWPQQGPI